MVSSRISLLLLVICFRSGLILAKPAQKYSPGLVITPTETQSSGRVSGVIGGNAVDIVETPKPARVKTYVRTYVQPQEPPVVTYQQSQPVVYQRPQQEVYYQQPQQTSYSQYPRYYQQPQYSYQQPYSASTKRPSSSLTDILLGYGSSDEGSSSLSEPISSALGTVGALGAIGTIGTLGALGAGALGVGALGTLGAGALLLG